VTPFTAVEGVGVAVARPNIDTDVLIRIDRLIEHAPDQLGPYVFESWRFLGDGTPDPDFALNQQRYAGAVVLVAGENFGCGSSREHAVWALAAFGFRAVIAPSFGDIFRQNSFQNGLLTIALPPDEVGRIVEELETAARPSIGVDLVEQVVTTPAGRSIGFEIDAERRQALLAGLDDIGVTLQHDQEIEAFEHRDSRARPWNYRISKEATTVDLLVLAGDGVGQEVTAEAQRVLSWFIEHEGLDVAVHEAPFGIAAWRADGTLMTDETWERIQRADAILFGAIGSPEYADIPPQHRRPDWLLEMRRSLDLFENLRPVRAVEALLNASTLRPEVVRGVDMVIVRELAGGIYFGQPRGVEALPDGTRRAFNTAVYTTGEVQRIARSAFELARTRSGRVCSVDKANVLEFGAFWREIVQAVGDDEYPDVELSHMYVDNCAMQLVRDPRQFDVIVTENLFGDILSDCAAMVTGSLGMLPSASRGPVRPDGRRAALYEPVHGSAPDIAGQGIANPLGAILSVAMCLRYTLSRANDAARLEHAVEAALQAGARTRDIAQPADVTLSTVEMTDRVIAGLEMQQ
jgi:3-isopropylmalate dehydrogenase